MLTSQGVDGGLITPTEGERSTRSMRQQVYIKMLCFKIILVNILVSLGNFQYVFDAGFSQGHLHLRRCLSTRVKAAGIHRYCQCNIKFRMDIKIHCYVFSLVYQVCLYNIIDFPCRVLIKEANRLLISRLQHQGNSQT